VKLQYTWEELRPIHPLLYTVFACQALGAIVNIALRGTDYWFDAAWQGGAIGTFIGFLAGMIVQTRVRRSSVVENRSMVMFCGIVAFLLFLAGLFFPLHGDAA